MNESKDQGKSFGELFRNSSALDPLPLLASRRLDTCVLEADLFRVLCPKPAQALMCFLKLKSIPLWAPRFVTSTWPCVMLIRRDNDMCLRQ